MCVRPDVSSFDNVMHSPALRYVFAVGLGFFAVATQFLIRPIVAPDSYQIFLGFVAVSVIYAGTAAGFITLGITAVAKLFFSVLPGATLSQGHIVVSRIVLFLAVGFIVCSLGGQLRRSE